MKSKGEKKSIYHRPRREERKQKDQDIEPMNSGVAITSPSQMKQRRENILQPATLRRGIQREVMSSESVPFATNEAA